MKHTITQDMLDRYVSGQSSLDEIAMVSLALKEDPQLRELVGLLEKLNRTGFLGEEGDLPMESAAAMSEGNLCDVLCERYILKDYPGAAEDYVGVALNNCWLKEQGVPLHNMGRLLERHGMRVSRRYDCTIDDIKDALSSREKVIAVVDYGQLREKDASGEFHAVVCLTIVDGVIRIYDPATDRCQNHNLEVFAKAWSYSKHYMVCASADKLKYVPHPIDVSDVDLDEDLMELTEAIAENAHEIWASKRAAEGWTFGPERNDQLLQHPDMVPYSELTEGEKYYDRDMALNTIRLVKKLGFNISRRYTLYCPQCGEYVSDTMYFCPNCGEELKR